MKTNIIYKVLFLIIFMVATIFMTRPVYAFTIETLDDSLDYNEIQNKEDEILDVVCNFIEVEKNNLIVDYSRAVKVYVDTNIFAYERLSTDVIRSLLDNAVYFWEVPVKVSDGEYVICTVSKVPPISEEIKQDLLDAQIFTEDEIIEEESKVGQWEIPTWAESQNQTDYIGNIETYIGETFNPDDEIQLYLLGGTPNIRQPF